MKENLISYLLNLEKQYSIQILVAAVTGSHSFGLSSSQSDVDVRFIYAHKEVKSYLSLSEPVRLLQVDEGGMDVVGWDIFKASRLLMKSNPSLYELLKSPIQLISRFDYERNVSGLIDRAYSKRALGHHYLRMLSTNLHTCTKKGARDAKTLKTWVHVYRSYGMLHYLIQEGTLPPLNVWELMESVVLEGPIKKSMAAIFMAKKDNDPQVNIEEESLHLLKGELPSLKEKVDNLSLGVDMEMLLNQINWSILKKEMESWDI